MGIACENSVIEFIQKVVNKYLFVYYQKQYSLKNEYYKKVKYLKLLLGISLFSTFF